MSISKIMTVDIVTIEMDDRLGKVKEVFDNTGFHHLLVMDNGKLMGVVSDRDLLKSISPHIGKFNETTRDIATLNKHVHQIMSRDLITLPADAGIYDAIHLFNHSAVSCIPIVDGSGRPVGIVSWRDIFRAIEAKREKQLGTPPDSKHIQQTL